MKSSLLFLVLLLVETTAAHAQKISSARVPTTVKATFAARFPTIKTVAWEKETQKIKQAYDYETHNDFWARDAFATQEVYEASFTLNGRKMLVVITPSDLVQETQISLKNNQLPIAVRTALARDFTTYQVQEAATITKADGSTLYATELARAGEKQDVRFSLDGQQAPR